MTMTGEAWASLLSWREEHLAEKGAATTLCGRVLRPSVVWTNRPKRPCAACRMRRATSERTDYVDRVLDFLLATDADTYFGAARDDGFRLNPQFFDGVEPWLSSEVWNDFAGDGDTQFFDDVRPSDLSEPLDVAIMQFTPERDLMLRRCRWAPPKVYRGHVQLVLPHVIEDVTAWPTHGECMRLFWGTPRPLEWRILNRGMRQSETVERFARGVQMTLGIQFTRRYQWRVYFSNDSRPGVTLPTDPIGAREVFRLRDIPDGRARRAALRHWVSEHWRKLRSDPVEETHVREHLRGETRFDWGGLECRIMPAPFDLERDENAKEKAAAMRREGLHRRLTEAFR